MSGAMKNRLCCMTSVRTFRLAALMFFALTWMTPPVFAQSMRINGGSVSQDKFGFYWETHLQPPTPPMSDTFTADGYLAVTADSSTGVIHRIMLDRSRRLFVGYDAIVEPLEEANTYRVTFRQLAMTPEWVRKLLGDNPSSWTQLPTRGWGLPAPQQIRGGEVISLTLLTNNTTRQTVFDYVTVQEPARKFMGFQTVPERRFAFAPGTARDFKAEDVQMSLQSPRLSINGRLDATTAGRYDDVSGSLVWFYTAKRGRFILSLTPRPELGFRKAGEVRGSSLSFVVGNDTFTLSTGGRIAPGEAPFNLYVLHDPTWKASYPNADLTAFIMGSADHESLPRK